MEKAVQFLNNALESQIGQKNLNDPNYIAESNENHSSIGQSYVSTMKRISTLQTRIEIGSKTIQMFVSLTP